MTSPENPARERDIRARATRRVAAKLSLYWHLAVFVLANAAMVAINLVYSPERIWFVWPLCAWAAAVLLHAFAVFQVQGMGASMVQREMDRERARRELHSDDVSNR
jgi:fatty acid desaturase